MTATTQPDSKPTSRRALLAGAIGGLGALAAAAIGRASGVRATNGDTVFVGGSFNETTVTAFTNTGGGNGLYASSTGSYGVYGVSGSGSGVIGTASSGTGVQGNSTSFYGVAGSSDTSYGVYGTSPNGFGVVGSSTDGTAIYGTSTNDTGVYGATDSQTHAGLYGRATGNGCGAFGYSGSSLPTPRAKTGVHGYAGQDSGSHGVWGESPTGIGVVGSTTSGYAGYFIGKLFASSFMEMSETTTPPAPVANRARLFVRDNGSGKSQLCVRFHTGAVAVLATEA
jgi:hypothetical protein